MGGKEINTPVAIGIAVAVVVVLLAIGMVFINRKPSASGVQQSAEDQKRQIMSKQVNDSKR